MAGSVPKDSLDNGVDDTVRPINTTYKAAAVFISDATEHWAASRFARWRALYWASRVLNLYEALEDKAAVDRLLVERKARGDYAATRLIDVISGGTASDERISA